MLFKESLQLHN